MISEYKTSELYDMIFLHAKGFPLEVDRTNPRRVNMLFKGDVELIKSLLRDFWDYNSKMDAMKLMESTTAVKRLLWVGSEYAPGSQYKRPEADVIRQINVNETQNTRTAHKQEE